MRLNKRFVATCLALLLPLGAILLACVDAGAPADKASPGPPAAVSPAPLQFLPDELAQRAQWEEFLEKAVVIEPESEH